MRMSSEYTQRGHEVWIKSRLNSEYQDIEIRVIWGQLDCFEPLQKLIGELHIRFDFVFGEKVLTLVLVSK